MKRGNVFANLDWFTVGLFLVMVFLGWLNIFSAVYSEEHPKILDFGQRYGKQFLWICASLVIALSLTMIEQRFYEFFAYVIYGLAVFLLIFVLVAGKEINGAKSWFMLGGFQIQPSEFAKPAVALALSKYLSGFNVNMKKLKTLLISGLIIFTPSVLIMLQPDTGSALVFTAFILSVYREGFSVVLLLFLVSLVIIFFMVLLLDKLIVASILIALGFAAYAIVSKGLKKLAVPLIVFASVLGVLFSIDYFALIEMELYFIVLISAGISGAGFIIGSLASRMRKQIIIVGVVLTALVYSFSVDLAFHNVLSEYQQRRVNVMLGFESDPQGAGYNVNQSKIAIGSGGFSGKGFLQGTQTKLHFVPEQSTDFIFCTVGEEWGFIGSIVVIGLFVSLFLRILMLAERQRTVFARVFGYSILSVMFLHFFVNIAMTIGLFPVIGIPLPFFSYGGSSLWSFTIMLFVFLRMDAGRMEYLR